MVRYGLTPDAVSPILKAAIAWACVHFCLRIVDRAYSTLFIVTGFTLWLSFHLWHPSEYSPLNSDVMGEFPHLAGLGYGLVMGVAVAMERIEKEESPPPSNWKEYIRHLSEVRYYWVPFSVVTASGYAFFLVHAYAMHQIFANSNYLFILLNACVITAFLAFACKQAKTPVIERTTNQDV